MTLDTLLTILGSNIVIAVFSYFTGKRRSDVETDNTILAGLEQSVAIYRDIIEDLRKEIEKLNLKIGELEAKIDELHQENKKLKAGL